MPEELANDREAQTRARADRRKRVPQVVQSNAFEARAPTDRRPGLLEIGARLVGTGAADDEGATARMRPQDLEGGAVQHYRLPPGLRVRQKQKTTPQVDVLPPQAQDLSKPGAREDQEAQRGSGVRREQGSLVFLLGEVL